MNAEDFSFVARLLRERSGLLLSPDKGYLLESRLLPIARKWNIESLDELTRRLRERDEQPLVRDVVEAMTTHESFFFRDLKPFEQFRSVVLPYLLAKRAATRHIKIWCAACSSGQEPYSLAILLQEEKLKLAGWNIELLATDLSTEILARAQAGIYTQFEVQRGLPIRSLVKYFKQHGSKWVIDPAIRDMVRFRQFNLIDDMRGLGSFDVVLCRNVLIYLDQPIKTDVLERIAQQMEPDAFLYLGGAETVVGLTSKFQSLPSHRGLYHLARAESEQRHAAL